MRWVPCSGPVMPNLGRHWSPRVQLTIIRYREWVSMDLRTRPAPLELASRSRSLHREVTGETDGKPGASDLGGTSIQLHITCDVL